jgi:hypothetical protein
VNARCPSDLALESHLLAPERSSVAAHLGLCDRCRGRLARMQEQGEEFRRFVFPATVQAVEDAAARRRPRLAFLFAPAGALAAAAAALLLVLGVRAPEGPSADYVGLKGGGGVGLAAYVSGDGGARSVEDGAAIPASAALRFKVGPAGDCWLWILSLDAKGQVSRIYPPKDAAVENRPAGPVPGGAVLDGEPGPERLFAVCAPPAMAWGDVRASVPAGAGPQAVREARALAGPLARARQSTLLLEKQP